MIYDRTSNRDIWIWTTVTMATGKETNQQASAC